MEALWFGVILLLLFMGIASYLQGSKRWTQYLAYSFVVLVVLGMYFVSLPEEVEPEGILWVHFIDVNQGDAILVQFPSGETILIDGGYREYGDTVSSYLEAHNIGEIDYLIGTHPHADHIGGLITIIEEFEIGEVYLPKVGHTTRIYENLLLAIKDKGLRIKEGKAGVTLDIAQGEALMVGPVSDGYENLNDFSIVLRVSFGNTAFLFTGDAGLASEHELMIYSLEANVLKVGHHGSSTATSWVFLKAVKPEYGVIMVGSDNTYGHPHSETLLKLDDLGVVVLRTDLHGDIVMGSDGQNVWVEER